MQIESEATLDARIHAEEIRRRKRAECERIGLDDAKVGEVVEAFYSRIREDDLLGPIFAEKITDWPPHLERMKQFWRSILFSSGEFSGNPMLKHQALPRLTEEHFSRWLTLFYATLREQCANPAAVSLMGGRARMIAESLLIGIDMQRDGFAGARNERSLPHV